MSPHVERTPLSIYSVCLQEKTTHVRVMPKTAGVFSLEGLTKSIGFLQLVEFRAKRCICGFTLHTIVPFLEPLPEVGTESTARPAKLTASCSCMAWAT